jgi:hypothetical protein
MNKPSRLVRLLIALLAAIVGALTLAGCDSSSGQDPTYTPAAYYQTISGVNDCYYVDDSAEVTALISAGLCPVHSVAVLAPLSWQEEYFSYYSSPAYYDTYMPVSYRSHYTSVTIISFRKTYSKQISVASSKAVYKSSAGGTVSGSKVNTKQFGGGTRSATTYGGGSRNGGTSKSGTYSGSKSGYGSGSRSGGGSRH